MERILDFLQINTPRAAKVLLTGAVALFVAGIFTCREALQSGLYSESLSYLITFYSIWFLVTGAYISLGGWALLSGKGRNYLSKAEKESAPGRHGFFWYLRFLFACFGIALATIVLMSTVFLLLLGPIVLHKLFVTDGGIYVTAFALLWAPFIYKYLRQ